MTTTLKKLLYKILMKLIKYKLPILQNCKEPFTQKMVSHDEIIV